jgi:hypothetical protein
MFLQSESDPCVGRHMPVIGQCRELEENKRYAKTFRLEQQIDFFCLLQSEAALVLRKKQHWKKTSPGDAQRHNTPQDRAPILSTFCSFVEIL